MISMVSSSAPPPPNAPHPRRPLLRPLLLRLLLLNRLARTHTTLYAPLPSSPPPQSVKDALTALEANSKASGFLGCCAAPPAGMVSDAGIAPLGTAAADAPKRGDEATGWWSRSLSSLLLLVSSPTALLLAPYNLLKGFAEVCGRAPHPDRNARSSPAHPIPPLSPPHPSHPPHPSDSIRCRCSSTIMSTAASPPRGWATRPLAT